MRTSTRRRTKVVNVSTEVAAALLALDDVAALSESMLCDIQEVQHGASDSRALFAEGLALQSLLRTAVASVLEKLPAGDTRVERVAATLRGVSAGRSIAAIARDHLRTREYWSRTYWKRATELIARELVSRNRSRSGADK